MTAPIRFVVPGRPVPQGSMRRGKGLTMYHSNKALLPWRKAIGWAARAAMGGRSVLAGPLCLDVVFHLPRPKRPEFELPAVKPDGDKLLRAVADALTGITYTDDAQVVSWRGVKVYADRQPGAVIEVRPYVAATDRPTAFSLEVG